MLPLEHSAILLTCIKRYCVLKPHFSVIFEWRLKDRFYCILLQHALPHLRKTKGSITNISSIAGGYGQDEATTYCATKVGLLCMMLTNLD